MSIKGSSLIFYTLFWTIVGMPILTFVFGLGLVSNTATTEPSKIDQYFVMIISLYIIIHAIGISSASVRYRKLIWSLLVISAVLMAISALLSLYGSGNVPEKILLTWPIIAYSSVLFMSLQGNSRKLSVIICCISVLISIFGNLYIPYVILFAGLFVFAYLETGIKRLYYRKAFFTLILTIMGIAFSLLMNSNTPLKSFKFLGLGWTGFDLIILFSFYSLSILVSLIVLRLSGADIGKLDKINVYLVTLVFTMVIFSVVNRYLSKYFNSLWQDQVAPIVMLCISGCLSFLLTRKISSYNILSTSATSARVRFMNQSYAFIDASEYIDYASKYLETIICSTMNRNRIVNIPFFKKKDLARNLDSKTTVPVSFIKSPEQPIYEIFPLFEQDKVKQIWQIISGRGSILNIDKEHLESSVLGELLHDYSTLHTPHLFIPVFDYEDNLAGIMAFGGLDGGYWLDGVVNRLNEILKIFRSFYLQLVTQERYRLQSVELTAEIERNKYVNEVEMITREKNLLLEEKQHNLIRSLSYASLIQKSILPQTADMSRIFRESFVIWKPRDIVGGDFYWLHELPGKGEILFAVIDCTGHGVPGALISMSVNSLLNTLVMDRGLDNPAEILTQLHRETGALLHQEAERTQQDGFEIAMIRIDTQACSLVFSGAGLSLLMLEPDGGEPELIHGDRHGIGGLKWRKDLSFTEQSRTYMPSTKIYLFTDGILDQPHPHKARKLRMGIQHWLDFIAEISRQDLAVQETLINEHLDTLLSYHEQRDDITIIGLVLG